MSCARYHNWKHKRPIGLRSKMGIKNIKSQFTQPQRRWTNWEVEQKSQIDQMRWKIEKVL